MKKRCLLMGYVMLLLLVLTGCGKKIANEKQMQEDMETATSSKVTTGNEKIVELTIDKRQTDKKQKTDMVWCSVTTSDDYISYQKEVILTYGLYDEGWILDDVSVNARDQWIVTPLQGINEDEIAESLLGETIMVGDDMWAFSDNSIHIKDITVKEHNTDLNAGADAVAVRLTVESEIQESVGELVINYIFDREWRYDSKSVQEEFTASYKPEAELQITDEELASKIDGASFVLENPQQKSLIVWNADKEMHTVSIRQSEISDFAVKNLELQQKGTRQIFHCECLLTKPCATFALTMDMPYRYQNGTWQEEGIDITGKCETLEIVGEWKGIYLDAPYNGSSVLNIQNVDENGNITAIYSYAPSQENRYSQPGSYYVSGPIDMYTLDMDLIAGDWIEEPNKVYSWTKGDIKATLCVDEEAIKGKAQEAYGFEVTR